jgi:MoaA/NifB/PqqE/SkfB family radical SAM enzyme
MFCAYPFVSFTLNRNNVKPCCRYLSNEFPHVDDEFDPYKTLNGDFFSALRQRMLDGEKLPECQRCYDKENASGRSPRTAFNKQFKSYVDETSPNSFEKLRFLEMSIDNLCNYECRICSSGDSSKLQKRDKYLGKKVFKSYKANVNFLRKIDLSELQQVSLLGGEPFLSPNLKEIFDIIEEQVDLEKIIVEFNSNGSTIPSQNILKTLKKIGTLYLDFSLDATHNVNDYIRHHSSYKEILKNAEVLKKENIEVGFKSTISLYNADFMNETKSYIEDIGYRYEFHIAANTPSQLDYAPRIYQDWLLDRVQGTYFEKFYENFYKDKQYSEQRWNEFIEETQKLDIFYGIKLKDYHPDLVDFLNI